MRTLKTQTTRGRRNCEKLRSRRAQEVPSRASVLSTCSGNVSSDGGKMVTEKLQALKSLLPPLAKQNKSAANDNGEETEDLFQETADYIVRLRTQVVVLQKLIEIYGNSSDQKKEVVL